MFNVFANRNVIFSCVLFATFCGTSTEAAPQKGKLKVFILAGQSNMEGHAKVETFDYIGDDPKTAPILKEMRGPDGKPRICDNAWITYYTGLGDNNGEGFGKLTAGYGSRRNPTEDGGKIGPEFTFGIYMDKALDEPVLIIKTAWGGKSLFYDFRPPSAGPFQRSEQDIKNNRNTPANTGRYYRMMAAHVNKVLNDIKRVYPNYDEKQGYEIAGFIWFQGFNDMVTRSVYPEPPKDSQKNRFAKYSQWMADFIRDTRKDFKTPDMPFIIGVMGVGGNNPNDGNRAFRAAMAAPAALPEFKNNVRAIQTGPFWDAELSLIADKYQKVRQMNYLLRTKNKNAANKDGKMTKEKQREYLNKYKVELISPKELALWQRGASNAGYHYLGCAKTFALMGKAYAKAMLELMKK